MTVVKATEDLYAPTLEERVTARAASLTASEMRVAVYLCDHSQEVAFETAETLGSLTQTSDATVIRAVKALGYDGLPDLKRALRDVLQARLTPAARLSRSLDWAGVGGEEILEHVLDLEAELLQEARRTISPAAFVQAASLIAEAHEVLTFGIGPLGALAEYFTLRLQRQGMRARSATQTGFRLADNLVTLGSDDVLVVVAWGRLYQEIEVTLDHAARVGAKVILITDTLGPSVAGRVSVSLSAMSALTGTTSSVTTTVAILEALGLAVAAIDRKHSVEALQTLNELRSQLGGRKVTVQPAKKSARSSAANGKSKPR